VVGVVLLVVELELAFSSLTVEVDWADEWVLEIVEEMI